MVSADTSSPHAVIPLEGKIRMNEAREAIINRLALELPTSIDLDRFLSAVVKELGQMMGVDRCDVIQLTSDSELRISHEWRASDDVPSSGGIVVPIDLRELSQHIDLSKPIRLNDTSAAGLPPKISFLASTLGTRSLLVVPVELNGDVLGLVGLHHTRAPREWQD